MSNWLSTLIPEVAGFDLTIPVAIAAGMIGVLVVWFLVKRTAKLLVMLSITALIGFIWWYSQNQGLADTVLRFLGR